MADIELKCVNCDTVVRISEFADVEAVVCKKCGGKLQKPGKAAVPSANKPRPTIRATKPEEVNQGPVVENAEEWRFHKTIKQSKAKAAESDKQPLITHHVLSWVLFVILGTAMGFMRYGNVLSAGDFATMQQNGVYVLIAFYILIILRAFKDTIFQGILCVLIPGYGFFYLFFVSDDFYGRAVVMALLIGLGQDAALIAKGWALEFYMKANDFISSGGGDISRK